MGFFWKRSNAEGAIAAAIGTFVFSLLMRVFLPEVSFIDRMGYVFLLCAATMFLLGWLKKPANASKAIIIDPALFRTTRLFKGLSILIMVILSTIYYIFW